MQILLNEDTDGLILCNDVAFESDGTTLKTFMTYTFTIYDDNDVSKART